ncbi:MAG: glycine C-acetyltransferase [bacterium]|nr:glycine C-acetyltransferase [bacterium]
MGIDYLRGALSERLEGARRAGTFKTERVITTRQGTGISVESAGDVINFCANNYLGLSGNESLVERAKEALDRYGFGLSSVRFIVGTHSVHLELERRVAAFVGKRDAILYSSCFDANGGLFEVLFNDRDAVLSDSLNHASLIDGIRLCKAERFRYDHLDMQDLEDELIRAREARMKAIVTDGVFSMDGEIAPLPQICDLAEKYDALVIVDDSHATGFIGENGRGTTEYHGVGDRVHIITSTFGKALGGASGGFTAGPPEVVEALRQFSRPYLFSNTLAPVIAATTLAVLDILEESGELRERLRANQRKFRKLITEAGFDVIPGDHPIVPIMLYNAKLASDIAGDLLKEGVYVIGFSYPVVPQGLARIRVQLSAAHTDEQIDRAVEAFTRTGERYGILNLGRDAIIRKFGP